MVLSFRGGQRDQQNSETHDEAETDLGPLFHFKLTEYHNWDEGTEQIGKADKGWTKC